MKTTLKKIILHGEESTKLLQRITTQDIYTCQQPKLAALCNANGRVLVTFWVQYLEDAIHLWADISVIPILLSQLRFYDPFCQLGFHLANETVYATEACSFSTEPSNNPLNWALFLIQKGIITLSPDTSGKYTPHMLNLDKLDAISLTKGCFIGYEVIARTHTRGKTKRRLTITSSDTPPPDALNTAQVENGHLSLVISSLI